MIVSLVAAVAANGVIGRGAELPWRLPADLKRFRELTLGHHVVMGRRTHASIGRALDGRTNLVLTSRPDAVAPGCRALPSLEEALSAARAAGETETFVIGGAAVYERALALADQIYLTRVGGAVEGDVFFPSLDPERWHEVARELRDADERNPYPLAFTLLESRTGGSSPDRRRG